MVVAPEARGRGYADELMRAAMLETGDRAVVLDAQTGLAGWYATFGFEVTGPEFDDDGVLHLPMRREGQAEGYRPLRSRSSVRATRCPETSAPWIDAVSRWSPAA